MNAKPISESKMSVIGRYVPHILGFSFLIIGSLIFLFLFVLPMLRWNAAQSWPATEGVIKKSRIVEHRGEDSTTYRAEFTYNYKVNGVTLTCDEYGFFDFSGSRKGARARLNKFPVGTKLDIYYNPADPAEAIMDRSLNAGVWFGLLPLLFMIIGATVLWFTFFGEKEKSSAKPSKNSLTSFPMQGSSSERPNESNHPGDLADQEFDGPLKLKPETSKAVALVVSILIGLFWNGIVWLVLLANAGDGFGWFNWLFFTPFVLIGLAIFGYAFYVFLSMFNPKVVIALSNGAVPLGSEVDVAWEVTGNVTRFRQFDIMMVGEEIATYRRGTDTYTDTEQFEIINVLQTNDPEEIAFGSVTVSIPENVMHTMEATNNKIKWSIVVLGEIPLWPDVNETLVFRVRPNFNG